MNPTTSDHRLLVSQLAEELAWLQTFQIARQGEEKAGLELRFAEAILRNAVGPSLDLGGKDRPLHVAVVGGAGTGKSTLVNFIVGQNLTDANAQAGYTRHPIAYGNAPPAALADWGTLGFLGPLKRLEIPTPANLDEDVYQYRAVDFVQSPLPESCVVWDCPDVTTWAAQGYIRRVIEVLALADLIVFVASDERYNDVVPTLFLKQCQRAGKAILICITKMKESDAPTILKHFADEILAGNPNRVPIVAIPFLSVEALHDPTGKAAPFRIPVLNAMAALLQPEADVRRRTVVRGRAFLESCLPAILEAGRQELRQVAVWDHAIAEAKADFEANYQREFGVGSSIADLQVTPEQILQRLEPKGQAKWLAVAFWALRQPYELVRGGLGKVFANPTATGFREADVIERGLQNWLDRVRAAGVREAKNNPFWGHVSSGFQAGLGVECLNVYRSNAVEYSRATDEEIGRVSRALLEPLDGRSSAWNALRGFKTTLEIVAIGLGLWVGNLTWWTLIWIPLFVSAVHAGFEIGIRQYVNSKRKLLRQHRLEMLDRMILTPFRNKLRDWPLTAGSDYERLHGIAGKIEVQMKELGELVEKGDSNKHG